MLSKRIHYINIKNYIKSKRTEKDVLPMKSRKMIDL